MKLITKASKSTVILKFGKGPLGLKSGVVSFEVTLCERDDGKCFYSCIAIQIEGLIARISDKVKLDNRRVRKPFHFQSK